MIIDEENYLAHYGILRKSGRYPWGSGGDADARSKTFLDYVAGLRRDGLSDVEIARGVGMTTTELRAANSIAKNQRKQADIGYAQRLKDKGVSNSEIGRKMGINESSVRSLLAPGAADKADILMTTSNMLRDEVKKGGYIQIGSGVESQLGMSATRLSTAVAILKAEGYEVINVQETQLGTGNKTLVKVLAPPGTTYRDVVNNRDQIRLINQSTDDMGRTFVGIDPPLNISSKRVAVRYAEEGGADADGVIYVRPGVKDVSIGAAPYAQVRIAVDGTHYLKGMAMYKDDLPDGVDLMFNTNKTNTGNKLDAMKKQRVGEDGIVDQENPFGSTVRQIRENPNDPRSPVTSSMNLVNEAGDWDRWSKNLSTQMLSKQSPLLAKTQLDLTHEQSKADLDEILALTNPVVRKKLLEAYADSADASAIHMKAAALPRQRSQVILPINSLKDTEVYAPNYRNGERVVLVRYPHGGKFEIPELVVNNNHPPAKKALGNAPDAIGINSKVAARLSGADFDGDTVLVIPNNSNRIKTEPALQKLKGFDPQSAYPAYEGMKPMSSRTKGIQMGLVSNLITDMTIQGASNDELARAVKHSMVVIDAEKHNLNYKQSAIDNGIPALMSKYQGRSQGGASTLISRKKTDIRVAERKQSYKIDPATGKKIWIETGASYVNKTTGETVVKTSKVKKLAEVDDANQLSSGTPIEKIYADHSNRMKALGDQARKEYAATQPTPYSPSAKKTYASEVKSLDVKLKLARQNKPLERQAQLIANTAVSAKRAANPEMDAAELKKLKGQELKRARERTGAKKQQIEITPAEWAAIQAGAISTNQLSNILDNADLDQVKALATPRTNTVMTPVYQRRAQAMLNSGYTQAEVADALGVSLSTLKSDLNGGGESG